MLNKSRLASQDGFFNYYFFWRKQFVWYHTSPAIRCSRPFIPEISRLHNLHGRGQIDDVYLLYNLNVKQEAAENPDKRVGIISNTFQSWQAQKNLSAQNKWNRLKLHAPFHCRTSQKNHALFSKASRWTVNLTHVNRSPAIRIRTDR